MTLPRWKEFPASTTNRATGEGGGVKNVEWALDGDILAIRIDLTQEFGPSHSGKTTIIDSTEGTVAVGPNREEKIGLHGLDSA